VPEKGELCNIKIRYIVKADPNPFEKNTLGAILRANLAAWLYLAQTKYLALGLNKV